MINVETNKQNFKTLNEILLEYRKFSSKEKIETLRNLSKNITYNEDQQIFCFKNNFLDMILEDIDFTIKASATEESSKDKEIYVKLFFLFFHNLIIGNVEAQCKVFDDIFLKSETFEKLKNLTTQYIYDNKIKKFLLSIFFNIIFSNSKNLSRLNQAHFDFFIMLITALKYNLSPIDLQNDKDLSEINDWVHILFKYIVKSEAIIKFNCSNEDNSQSKGTILYHMLNLDDKNERILMLELLRDYVDNAKDSETLYIYEENLKKIIEIFYKNVITVNTKIDSFYDSSFSNYQKLIFDNKSEYTFIFREFLCLVDILSVFLVSENNFYCYRNSIQNHIETIYKTNNYSRLIEIFYNLLSLTDVFYDNTFKRNKSLNPHEGKDVPRLEEKNILFGFQTNVMKILSNFSLKNNELKSYLINNSCVFYYFLNHMKLDKCNPFKKEWTVLFIKSTSENNLTIQNFIRDLQPECIDPLLKDYIINKGTDLKIVQTDNLNESNKKETEEDD